MKLDGKLALVTGAGSGIGRATATALAEAGAHLVVCDVDPDRTRDVAAELGDACVLARPVDVGDRGAMQAFADEVHRLQPALDVLVNNAGVGVGGGILDTPLESWDWLLRVNLMGVVHGCHFFAPAMAARGSGHIVNVSSIFGYFASPSVVAYVASKFAVLGMSMAMRGELAAHGVGVTAICPGLIATNIIHGSRMSETLDTVRGKVADTFAKRGAPPSKVAAAIVRAVRRDRAVVPVAPEAWLAWGLTRALPGVSARFGGRLEGVLGIKHV
jgi:NAD(P)-dependent dehydrogenase (short-subunit alcohol dehydrogenase family)